MKPFIIARRFMTHPALPIIQAPMFLLSGPEMVIASAKAGIIGSFPTPNTRTADELEQWLIHNYYCAGYSEAPPVLGD